MTVVIRTLVCTQRKQHDIEAREHEDVTRLPAHASKSPNTCTQDYEKKRSNAGDTIKDKSPDNDKILLREKSRKLSGPEQNCKRDPMRGLSTVRMDSTHVD